MKILCLFQKFSFRSSTIYLDLVEALVKAGHEVTVVAGTTQETACGVQEEHGCRVVYLRLPDQFKAGKIKKGLVQLFLEPKMLSLIRKYLWEESFTMILYPTPPITLANVVKKCRSHYKALSYLMLKDIFPQNAVDLGMMAENGLIHKYFQRMERKLYRESDVIGCMSPANIAYMKGKLPPGEQTKLELFPNTVRIKCGAENVRSRTDRETVHFVFGGNMGKPQGIENLLKGMELLKDYRKAEFFLIGDGTESRFVEEYVRDHALVHVKYQKELPREEYEEILQQQDIGIVSLSSRFTIPNFPSRILSYMQMGKPVLAVTDRCSDIGHMITEEAGCGYFCVSDDPAAFAQKVKEICENSEILTQLGANGRRYLEKNYNVERSVAILEGHDVRGPVQTGGKDMYGK